jgi:NADH-quinone oxidoreductase B subunit
MSWTTKLVTWARRSSPWVIHFNTGACNACDIEIVASLTPRFDIERFGCLLKGTPRHADVLLCSGPVTGQVKNRLKRIYEQMAEPKFVIAVGTCACSGGVFSGCYNVSGGIDSVIPVSAYVPGCPARPEAIIDGAVKLLGTLVVKEEIHEDEPLDPHDDPEVVRRLLAAKEAHVEAAHA